MRRIVKDPFKEKIVEAEVQKAEAAKKAAFAASINTNTEDGLDGVLKTQLVGLSRLTNHLVKQIQMGEVNKDTAQQLATCIKITMELKAKERQLLEDLSDDELKKIADDEDEDECL